jgi:polar amino acid transport system permease protein
VDSLALLSFGPNGWGNQLAGGVAVTVALSLAILPVGLIAGFFVALGKQSS